jgi:regulation of enolase protein 1 (concanavalin A-like superfamily)
MASLKRVVVELSPYSVQLAIIAGRQLVACGEYALDAKEALTGFLAANAVQGADLALISPRPLFAHRADEAEAGQGRSPAELLAFAQTLPTEFVPPFAATACDAITGKPVEAAGQGPWFLAGTTAEALTVAREQLSSLGLAPVRTGLALPAQLGAVVTALQDMPESTRVAVLALGENASVLALVSAGGIEAAQSVPVGYGQIFEAVQAELGLKFRAAATKLFFNDTYEFGDAALKIAGRVGQVVRPVLETLGGLPSTFQCLGLPGKQAWFACALGQSLELPLWAPDAAAVCAQLGLEATGGSIAVSPSLIRQAANVDEAWLPAWLDGTAKKEPVKAAAPKAAVAALAGKSAGPAVAGSAVQAPVKSVPAAKPALVASIKSTPAPAPVRTAAASVIPPDEPAVAPDAVDMEDPPVAPAKKNWALYAGIGVFVLIVAGAGKFYADARSAKVPVASEAPAPAVPVVAAPVVVPVKEKELAPVAPVAVAGLPAPWTNADIGAISFPGRTEYTNGAFTLTGTGNDIGGRRDAFHFAYVPMNGDGSITARVSSITGSTRVAKIGVMIRESLTPDARHVSLQIQSGGGSLRLIAREKTNANTTLQDPVRSGWLWVRLVRNGGTITAYQSEDGSNWAVVGNPVTIALPGTVYAGLVACSRTPEPVYAIFDHVSAMGWGSSH